MKLMRRIVRSPAVQTPIGVTAAAYLRMVWSTSRVTLEPHDLYEIVEPDLPAIIAMWHGQHFLLPFLMKPERGHKAKVLISRHYDGEINAIAAERLGIDAIRGSGDTGGRFDVKGGVGAFTAMLDALDEGYTMALTADVPKIARVVGTGIVKLASFSGRPIYAVAVASSRRRELDNWDRTTFNLPFSRVAVVGGGPVWVPR